MARVLPSTAILVPDEAVKVFSGVIYDVYHWDQTMYDGSKAKFEMLKRPDTVGVVCIKDDKLVFVEEFQPNHVHRVFFPTGRVDPGETWEEAAKREVLEETGFSFKNMKLVFVTQPISKIEWFVAWFVAWDFTSETTPKHENGEKITVKTGTLDDVLRQILAHDQKIGRVGFVPRFLLDTKSVQDIIDYPEFKG